MTPPNVALYKWIRHAFVFRGRSSRSDYWWTRAVVFSVNLVLIFVLISALTPEAALALEQWFEAFSQNRMTAQSRFPVQFSDLPAIGKFSLVFLVVFALLTFIPDLSLSWRRMQDLNLPGWLHLIVVFGNNFLPFLIVAELCLFIFPGTRGPNRYGLQPIGAPNKD